MQEENNPPFISLNCNTEKDGAKISTDNIVKTELNDETDVDNHEVPTTKNQSFPPIIMQENDHLQGSNKTILTDSDSAIKVIPTDSSKVGRKLCHNNMTDKITTDKLHACFICTKTFTHESKLTLHLRKHTREKPYQCSSCEKKFSQKSSVDSHMRIHTGDKPYQCTTCMKFFTQSHHLSRHILTHTGEKKHKCPICSKSFSQKSNLDRHILRHTGDKSHQCIICGKLYFTKQELNSHMRTHAGEKLNNINIPILIHDAEKT